MFFAYKKLRKPPKKLHTYGSWEFVFSAAQTAQNSPDLHFRFINYFIRPFRVGSLLITNCWYQAWNLPYIVTLQHQQAYLNSYARISLFLHFPMHFYISCFKAINAWFIYHSRSDISLCCQQCITSSSNVQFHSMLRVTSFWIPNKTSSQRDNGSS